MAIVGGNGHRHCQDITPSVHNMVIQTSQRAFTCSKLTIETLEQGAEYVQSYQ